MKFTVNLFENHLLPQKVQSSFHHLLQMLVGIFVLGLVAVLAAQWFISFQSKQLANEKAVLSVLTAKQQQLEQQLAENKADPRLVAQVNLAKSRLNLKQLLLTELDHRTVINRQGFSRLLTDLAAVPAKNLWLEGIYVKDKTIKFEGFSLKAEDVPLWIESLKTTDTLRGFSFAAMTMSRGENKPLAFLLSSKPLVETQAAKGSNL